MKENNGPVCLVHKDSVLLERGEGQADVMSGLTRDGLRQCMADVEAFHDKIDISRKVPLKADDVEVTEMLEELGSTLHEVSEVLESQLREQYDPRVLRAHLCAEELAEFVKALAEGSELHALDALCDMLYVLVGSAVQFDLPLAEGFVEVHASNMTKEKQATDASSCRVRQKGPNYVAPDLARILREYRIRFVKPEHL